jgi:hypothetical protein
MADYFLAWSRRDRSRIFFLIDFFSQDGVRGDAAAFFQPASLNCAFVLMLFLAIMSSS